MQTELVPPDFANLILSEVQPRQQSHKEIQRAIKAVLPADVLSEAVGKAVIDQNVQSGWMKQSVADVVETLLRELAEFDVAVASAKALDSADGLPEETGANWSVPSNGAYSVADGSIPFRQGVDAVIGKIASEYGDIGFLLHVLHVHLQRKPWEIHTVPTTLKVKIHKVLNFGRKLGFDMEEAVKGKVLRNTEKYLLLLMASGEISREEFAELRRQCRAAWGEPEDAKFEYAEMLPSPANGPILGSVD